MSDLAQRCEDIINKGGRLFSLDGDQVSKINLWVNDHDCTVEYTGAIGGEMSFIFSPTSLGIVEEVHCACGEKLNVTDFDLW